MSATRKGCGVPLMPPLVSLLFGPFAPGRADLVDEGAVRSELQDVRVVAEAGRPGELAAEVRRLAVAGHVDEALVIDEDAVLARRPGAAVLDAALLVEEAGVGRAAPRLQQVAGLVELEHRRRRHAAPGQLAVRARVADGADREALRVFTSSTQRAGVGGRERPRAVVDPDVIAAVHVHPADVADDPVVRQRLGPGRVEHEARPAVGRRRRPGQPFEHAGLAQCVGARGGTLGAQRIHGHHGQARQRAEPSRESRSCHYALH